jgi:ribosome biogenesis GTPase
MWHIDINSLSLIFIPFPVEQSRKASYFLGCFLILNEVVIQGRIIKIESKDYYVLSEENSELRCSLRGKFKKEFQLKKDKQYHLDIAAVGDLVDFDLSSHGIGSIHNIHKRKNYISRKAPKIRGSGVRGERLEQIIATNVDNLFIVSSIYEPEFNNRLIDRIVVAGESSHVNVHIIINKIDIDEKNSFKKWQELYSEIGYNVFPTSAPNKVGIDSLKNAFNNKVNLLWGSSGVGKSSLLNLIYPQLDFKIGDISTASNKGKHTTVTSVMKLVENNTFVIDTPGIREFDPFGIKKEDLGHYFLEFLPFINECKFNTCTHYHEPQCAVEEAVSEGKLSKERYKSYLNLLQTVEDDIIF